MKNKLGQWAYGSDSVDTEATASEDSREVIAAHLASIVGGDSINSDEVRAKLLKACDDAIRKDHPAYEPPASPDPWRKYKYEVSRRFAQGASPYNAIKPNEPQGTPGNTDTFTPEDHLEWSMWHKEQSAAPSTEDRPMQSATRNWHSEQSKWHKKQWKEKRHKRAAGGDAIDPKVGEKLSSTDMANWDPEDHEVMAEHYEKKVADSPPTTPLHIKRLYRNDAKYHRDEAAKIRNHRKWSGGDSIGHKPWQRKDELGLVQEIPVHEWTPEIRKQYVEHGKKLKEKYLKEKNSPGSATDPEYVRAHHEYHDHLEDSEKRGFNPGGDSTPKMVYGVFVPPGKWAVHEDKGAALEQAKSNGGFVHHMPKHEYDGQSWDAPTFRSSTEKIADFRGAKKAAGDTLVSKTDSKEDKSGSWFGVEENKDGSDWVTTRGKAGEFQATKVPNPGGKDDSTEASLRAAHEKAKVAFEANRGLAKSSDPKDKEKAELLWTRMHEAKEKLAEHKRSSSHNVSMGTKSKAKNDSVESESLNPKDYSSWTSSQHQKAADKHYKLLRQAEEKSNDMDLVHHHYTQYQLHSKLADDKSRDSKSGTSGSDSAGGQKPYKDWTSEEHDEQRYHHAFEEGMHQREAEGEFDHVSPEEQKYHLKKASYHGAQANLHRFMSEEKRGRAKRLEKK